jgi:tetratricopeptide (TPR) repeat protein
MRTKAANIFALIAIVLFFCTACGSSWMDDYNKGVEYQQAGKIELSEQQFKIVIQKNPEAAEAYLNLGLIYGNRGWIDGGETNTQKAVEIFEKTHKTFIKGSTWEQAISLAYNNLGALEMQRALNAERESDKEKAKAKWESGMAYFQRAVTFDANNSMAQANIERFKGAYSN